MTKEQIKQAILTGFIETGRPLAAPVIAERLGITLGGLQWWLNNGEELDGVMLVSQGRIRYYQPTPRALLDALRASPPETFTPADAAELGRLFAKARAAEIDPAALPALRSYFKDIRATALWADLAAHPPPAGAAFPLAIDETC
jgi:hypothetical protein